MISYPCFRLFSNVQCSVLKLVNYIEEDEDRVAKCIYLILFRLNRRHVRHINKQTNKKQTKTIKSGNN